MKQPIQSRPDTGSFVYRATLFAESVTLSPQSDSWKRRFRLVMFRRRRSEYISTVSSVAFPVGR
jgi:hypothetical protein